MDTIRTYISNFFVYFILLLTSTTASATDVGTPNGTFTLSPTGGAVYSVAIETPKGINGMQPSLAVSYNSQSGHGIAGYGFNISGISVITRGKKSIYYDNQVTGINYTNDDAFYLDGKRLLLQSGVSGYEGAVYTPEGEPFTEVTLHTNTIQSSPCIWFEVKSDDGMTYQYGYASNQSMLIYKNGTYFQNAWYVGRAENQLGNYITYTYTAYGNSVYPYQITYGKNINGDGSLNYIYFTYEDQTYSIPSYHINGCTVTLPKRLKAINTTNGVSTYRSYNFSYSNMTLGNSDFSVLSSITEKNGDDEALNPITFSWQSTSGCAQSVSEPSVPLVQSYSFATIHSRSFFATDLNGDGFSEIIQISPMTIATENGNTLSTYLYINTTDYSGSTNTLSYQNASTFDLGPNFDFGDWSRKICSPIVLDFNGDGLNDLIVPNINVVEYNNLKYANFEVIYGKRNVYYSKSNYNIPLYSDNSPLFAAADIDNDGKSEIITLERDKYGYSYPMTIASHPNSGTAIGQTSYDLFLPSDPTEIFLADFNNNGLNDLMVVYDSGYTIYWNQTGTLWSTPFVSLELTSGTSVSHGASVDIGDFNGDGSPDFLLGTTGSSNWYIAYGNGDGTFNKQLAGTFDIYDKTTGWDDDKMRCLVYDFNGDGKSDVVIEKADLLFMTSWTGTMWLASTGTGLQQVKMATSQNYSDGLPSHYILGDFTGSGRTELMNYGYNCYSGNYANVEPTLHLYQQQSYSAKSGRLVSVTDGLGNLIAIDYSSLVNSGKYTPQSDAVFPVADITVPFNVVTKTTQANGAANDIIKLYEYGGMKAHLRGKGLLGFSMTKVTDQATQDSIKTILTNWDPQAFFVPKNSITTIHRSGQSESSSNTLTVVEKGNNNYFTYLSSKIETDIYGNTTSLTRLCNSNYGYVTSEEVSNSTNMYKSIAYSDYVKKGQIWLPQTITNTQKHEDDNDEYSDQTSITYDNYGLKTQIIEHYGKGDKVVTTSYGYDSEGNLLSEQSSGTGLPYISKHYTYTSNKRYLSRAYTNPSTTNIYYTYDDWGNLLTEQDRTNSSFYLTTTYTYDGWGKITSKTEPTGLVTNYSYGWGTSRAKKYYIYEKTQARSAIYKWYDACGREVLETSNGLKGVQLTHATTYDSKGRVSISQKSMGSASNTINYTYDSWDRVATISPSFEGSTSYTYGNRLVTSVKNGQTYTKTFDAWGNVKSSTDPVSSVTYSYMSNGKPESVSSNGSTITMEYDAVGNRTLLDDPDAGQSSCQYNALGNLTSQTDARGVVTQMTYDNLGRISAVTIGNVVTNYTYGTSGNSILKLTKKQCGDNYIQYGYDNYGRVSTEQRSIDNNNLLNFYYYYNTYDQILQITYPGSLSIGYTYDDYGYRTGMTANGNNIWSIGNYNGYSLSSSLEGWSSTRNYDNVGRVASKVRSGSSVDIIHPLSFMYSNTTGNVTARMGVTCNMVTEQFQYDAIDRLTGVTIPSSSTEMISYLASTMNIDQKTANQKFGNSTEIIANYLAKNSIRSGGAMTITYAPNGNISSKTGIGSYSYPNSIHPHAVTSVTNSSNLVSTATQNITYNEFGKVSSISDNGYSMSFLYGPDQERWKTVLTQNGITKRTTIYAGNYEKITEGGVTRQFYYLDDDVIGVKTNSGAVTFYKGWTDNQGTYLQLADYNYNVVFDAEYDAWGKQDVLTNTIGFHRGYTGHEMLPEFGLINMNGRLYDPLLGRFLSPDNYVQLPDFSQSFNRYSYCLNNPLKYTDPSGEAFGIDDAILIGVVISGLANVGVNWDEINSFGHGVVSFFTGAVSGGLSISGNPVLGALVAGAGNSIINQGFNNGWNNISVDAVFASTGMSLLTYGVGSKIGTKFDKITSKITNGIKNKILKEGIHDAISGALGGFTIGTGFSLFNGNNIGDALGDGAKYATQGAIINGLNGVNRGYSLYKEQKQIIQWEIEDKEIAEIATKPLENHHFASNKNRKYTPDMEKIAKKYNLDLNGKWNRDLLPHRGRHPDSYHEWVLDQMRLIDQMPNMNQQNFIKQFNIRVKQTVINNPNMLYRKYWFEK